MAKLDGYELKIALAILKNPTIPPRLLNWAKLIIPLNSILEHGLSLKGLSALFKNAQDFIIKSIEDYEEPNYRKWDVNIEGQTQECQITGEEVLAMKFFTSEYPPGYNMINLVLRSNQAYLEDLMKEFKIEESSKMN